VRNIHRPELTQPALFGGTEAAVGASPLRVKPTPAKTLGMSTRGTGGATQENAEPGAPAKAPDTATPTASESTAQPPVEGLRINGPAEAAAGNEITLEFAVPPQDGAITITVSYDPTLLEAVDPAPAGSGNVTVRAEGGQASLRLRALPGAKGETSVSVAGATVEGGGALQNAGASHTIRLN
jgi:general secretion pathway protein D